jgi:hypothetical protein
MAGAGAGVNKKMQERLYINPEHAKIRGDFAARALDRYSKVPGIDVDEFQATVKMVLKKLESPESFVPVLAEILASIMDAATPVKRTDKKMKVSYLFGTIVGASTIMVAALGERAINHAARIQTPEAQQVLSERVVTALEDGVTGKLENLETTLDGTVQRLIMDMGTSSDPFVKDAFDRIEGYLQRLTKMVPTPDPAIQKEPKPPKNPKPPPTVPAGPPPKGPQAQVKASEPAPPSQQPGFRKV